MCFIIWSICQCTEGLILYIWSCCHLVVWTKVPFSHGKRSKGVYCLKLDLLLLGVMYSNTITIPLDTHLQYWHDLSEVFNLEVKCHFYTRLLRITVTTRRCFAPLVILLLLFCISAFKTFDVLNPYSSFKVEVRWNKIDYVAYVTVGRKFGQELIWQCDLNRPH